MVNDHVNQFLFIRCIVLYNRKRETHRGMSMFAESLFFPSYVFRDIQNIYGLCKKVFIVIREITMLSIMSMALFIMATSMDFQDC